MKQHIAKPEEAYTIQELEQLLIAAATLVDRFGDEFLIYFTSVESWIEEVKAKNSAKNRVAELLHGHKNRATNRVTKEHISPASHG